MFLFFFPPRRWSSVFLLSWTTADIYLYVIHQSFWIKASLIFSFGDWSQFCHSPTYIPSQFKLKDLLDSLSSFCFLGNLLSSHKSVSAVSEVLPQWSCWTKFTIESFRLVSVYSDWWKPNTFWFVTSLSNHLITWEWSDIALTSFSIARLLTHNLYFSRLIHCWKPYRLMHFGNVYCTYTVNVSCIFCLHAFTCDKQLFVGACCILHHYSACQRDLWLCPNIKPLSYATESSSFFYWSSSRTVTTLCFRVDIHKEEHPIGCNLPQECDQPLNAMQTVASFWTSLLNVELFELSFFKNWSGN